MAHSDFFCGLSPLFVNLSSQILFKILPYFSLKNFGKIYNSNSRNLGQESTEMIVSNRKSQHAHDCHLLTRVSSRTV